MRVVDYDTGEGGVIIQAINIEDSVGVNINFGKANDGRAPVQCADQTWACDYMSDAGASQVSVAF